jgi:hypothetical protein
MKNGRKLSNNSVIRFVLFLKALPFFTVNKQDGVNSNLSKLHSSCDLSESRPEHRLS